MNKLLGAILILLFILFAYSLTATIELDDGNPDHSRAKTVKEHLRH